MRRGISNIVATMLIFSIMIASMGVLYSKISPTLFGYEAETKSVNQEFVFLSITNAMEELIASAEGSQGRIHIISKQAIFSVNNGKQIQIKVNDSNGLISSTSQINLGVYYANVSGVFEPQNNPVYLVEGIDEITLLSGDNTASSKSYVSKVDYSKGFAKFSLYFKVRLDITSVNVNLHLLTITIVKIVFNTLSDGKSVDFPVELEEWTLRLRRGSTNVTSVNQAINGDIIVSDGIGGNVTFTGLSGSLTIKFIEIPIKFGI